MKPTCNLTAVSFFTSAQEIVLVERHGRLNEDDDNHRSDKNNIYQATEAMLKHRELEYAVTLESPNLIANIKFKRFYHQDGRVCRIHYVEQSGSEIRQRAPKEHEHALVQFAAWAAAKFYATPPRGCRLVYHVRPADDMEAPILETWVTDLPLAPTAEIEAMVTAKLEAIAAARAIADDNDLPPCNEDERHGTTASPFKKCVDFCRARTHCRQYAAYRAKSVSDGPNTAKAFSTLQS